MLKNKRVREASIKQLQERKSRIVKELLKLNKQLDNLKKINEYNILEERQRINK